MNKNHYVLEQDDESLSARERRSFDRALADSLAAESSTPWDKLLQSPGMIECDLSDVLVHIADSLASGDFPDIPGISNCCLSDSLSGQFDAQNDTLLLAGNDAQILLSVEEQEALFHELYARRDARYMALHQE